jgi:hypothetical protein
MKFSSLLMLWIALTTQAAQWTTTQDTQLYFPATEIGAGTALQVLPQSTQGGHVLMVNTQVWTARYTGPGTGEVIHDQPIGLVVDGAGNVTVAGDSYARFSGSDFAVIKYSPKGNALSTNRFTGADSSSLWGDICRKIAIDGSGNVYVSGESGTNSGRDIVTLKYSSNSVPVWTNRFGVSPTNGLQLSDFAIDSSGNTFVLAHDFAQDSRDWIAAYDPYGAVRWTNLFQASFPNGNYAFPMGTDSHGTLFVGAEMPGPGGLRFGPALARYMPDGTTGSAFVYSFRGLFREMLIDHDDNVIMTAELPWDGATIGHLVAKLANDGALLWTNVFAGPTYSGGTVPGTVIDRAGNIYTTFGSAGTASADGDFTTVKLTTSGVPVWTNRFFNPNGRANFSASAADLAGNCHVLFTATKPGESNNLDYVLLKLAPDGSRVWTNRLDSGDDDFARALVLDPQGNLFVTGGTGRPWQNLNFLTAMFSDYVLYTPPPGFVGTDAFQFTAVDRLGNTVTGEVSVTVSPAPLRLGNATFGPSGFRMRVEAGEPAKGKIILASSNLVHWTAIATNGPGVTEFADPGALGFHQRFYKAVTSDIESRHP